ncbi:hypothetical protein JTE90_018230 [Oedothorax gibbosus]|uniref:Uncharacterized protein n=1 Tax=Oedothorax gibbosus TaxID=931172 RepID=A0AAV6U7R6_9ARAC|nr:hypothetical protein JTE90_018230 [Oedothorax gibbosus]
MAKVKHRRYNRFLSFNENLPRSTLWRRNKEALLASTIDIENDTPAPAVPMDTSENDPELELECESNTVDNPDPKDDPDPKNDPDPEDDAADPEDDTDEDDSTRNHPQLNAKFTTLKFSNNSDPLYVSSDVTTLEAYITILAFYFRFNLSRT